MKLSKIALAALVLSCGVASAQVAPPSTPSISTLRANFIASLARFITLAPPNTTTSPVEVTILPTLPPSSNSTNSNSQCNVFTSASSGGTGSSSVSVSISASTSVSGQCTTSRNVVIR
jgi:hypothetical protein